MSSRTWDHTEVGRVTGLDGDAAALGAAVTTVLCGHWEHDGPCRWPHFTSPEVREHDVLVTVYFDAPAGEEQEVRALIRHALAKGCLVGPDGTTTAWQPATP